VSEINDASGELPSLLDLLAQSHSKVEIVTMVVTRDAGLQDVGDIYRMLGRRCYRRT
jgi:hypothetical protein